MDLQLTSSNYKVPTQLASQLITSAWILYYELGATNRSHREIVNDPVYKDEVDKDGFMQKGDVILPSLCSTVQENLLYHTRPMLDEMPRVLLPITDDIIARAAEDADLIRQSALFKLLQDHGNGSEADGFLNSIGMDLNQPEIAMGKIKKLCYVYTMADRIREDQHNEQLWANASSEPLAPIGHTAKVEIKLLRCVYNREHGIYNHMGITPDGFVVSFFNKASHTPPCNMIIEGKIKDHRRMYRREHVSETRMNYVKIHG